jgi:hypothetical protein
MTGNPEVIERAWLVGFPDKFVPVPTCPVCAFYKGESQGKKQPRRLEGARTFAALSSPSHVERLWGIRSSQIHSVFVTALSDSEARQAARLNVVNHSSI